MRTLIAPLRLRSSDEASRKVTWLELFFDLIFVAAVAQVAAPLREAYSLEGLARFTPLFVLVWWAWTGQSVFSTRFDTDDVIQRALWRGGMPVAPLGAGAGAGAVLDLGRRIRHRSRHAVADRAP